MTPELKKEFFNFYRTSKTFSKEEVWAWFEVEIKSLQEDLERMNRIVGGIDCDKPDAINVMIDAMSEQGKKLKALAVKEKECELKNRNLLTENSAILRRLADAEKECKKHHRRNT